MGAEVEYGAIIAHRREVHMLTIRGPIGSSLEFPIDRKYLHL